MEFEFVLLAEFSSYRLDLTLGGRLLDTTACLVLFVLVIFLTAIVCGWMN